MKVQPNFRKRLADNKITSTELSEEEMVAVRTFKKYAIGLGFDRKLNF